MIGAAVFLLIRRDKSVYPYKIALVLSFVSLQMALNKSEYWVFDREMTDLEYKGEQLTIRSGD